MKKILLLVSIAVVVLVGVGVYQYVSLYDGRLHVVFCDVGQGDAILVRTPGGKTLLVDGGPDKRVLDCLARHMGFWERGIDVMYLSHPHLDHYVGLVYVLDRYVVRHFVTEDLVNPSGGMAELGIRLKKERLKVRWLYEGDKVKLGDSVVVSVLGPSKEFLLRTSPDGKIGKSGEFASLISVVSYGEIDILLTGDSQVGGMREAAKNIQCQMSNVQCQIEVVQVPHHGSGTGLDREVLEMFSPEVGVISVGRGNRYGHPRGEILDLLREAGVRVFRTDEVGDVEVVSDGRDWVIR